MFIAYEHSISMGWIYIRFSWAPTVVRLSLPVKHLQTPESLVGKQLKILDIVCLCKAFLEFRNAGQQGAFGKMFMIL